jgi:hypothetical protein
LRSNCEGTNVLHHLRTMRYQGVYSQGHNIFDIYPEHFALFASFASFAVYDFGHRKVRKDSLNCLVFDYNPVKIRSLMQ